MKQLHSFIVASGAMLSLSLAVGPAIAADTADSKGPTAEEMKNSKDRGLIFVPVPGTDNGAKTKASTPVKKDAGSSILQSAPETTVTIKKLHTAKKTTATVKTTSTTKTPAAAKTPATHNVASASAWKPGKKAPITSTRPVVAKSTSKSSYVPVSFTDSGERMIKAWLNKTGSPPHYRDGERMQINVAAARDCNLMVFDFDGKGKLTQIYPNQYQQTATVKAGETIAIGGQDSPFDYSASVPAGLHTSKERIFVYAYPSDKESPISVAMSMPTGSPFRSGNMTIEQYRKMINQAPSYTFGTAAPERGVKITPKKQATEVSDDQTTAPNKIELGFAIDSK